VGRRPSATVVIWFRRDLRVTDHPALLAAVAEAEATGSRVAPLFVADSRLLARAGSNRRRFLSTNLAALDERLEGSLALRKGLPAQVVADFAAEVGATTVFATGDCAPYGRRRDTRVTAELDGRGIGLALVGSPYAVSPGRVRTGQGAPYRVFTPFRRAWAEHGWPRALEAPRSSPWCARDSDVAVDEIAGEATDAMLPAPGERAAESVVDGFLSGPIGHYDAERNRPDHQGTSHLSAYLRFGVLHPRQVLSRLGTTKAETVFRSELAWREFYADVLWHHPDSAWEPLQAIGRHLRWDTGPTADRRFEAWASGQTGYPLVDAGMRQLRAEGWMHNRLRMLTASFLVKDLHLDWRRGAAHFMDLLVDGDLASNNHGWQWVAGTGTDAAPFHRIFNPTLQAERFDPDGDYVDHYVPEAGGFGYPTPIVDHAAERIEALDRWQEAKLALAVERR
jgi:deoxyribodipyrimidine photo-lyase